MELKGFASQDENMSLTGECRLASSALVVILHIAEESQRGRIQLSNTIIISATGDR